MLSSLSVASAQVRFIEREHATVNLKGALVDLRPHRSTSSSSPSDATNVVTGPIPFSGYVHSKLHSQLRSPPQAARSTADHLVDDHDRTPSCCPTSRTQATAITITVLGLHLVVQHAIHLHAWVFANLVHHLGRPKSERLPRQGLSLIHQLAPLGPRAGIGYVRVLRVLLHRTHRRLRLVT